MQNFTKPSDFNALYLNHIMYKYSSKNKVPWLVHKSVVFVFCIVRKTSLPKAETKTLDNFKKVYQLYHYFLRKDQCKNVHFMIRNVVLFESCSMFLHVYQFHTCK